MSKEDVGGYTGRTSQSRVQTARATAVKNKTPANQQITVEQILREANEAQIEKIAVAPRQKITDPEELDEYRLSKRKSFEDCIRRTRTAIQYYVKYAQWEESQKDFRRARSVYERAIDVDYRNQSLWLKYAEMEMKHRHVNHARNVWDRAVQYLPRIDQFWYKYAYMEEILGNVAGARAIFERWMEWKPESQAFTSFIKFEMRYNEANRARAIFERFVATHTEPKSWLKYAKWEERQKNAENTRSVYERAIEALGERALNEEFFIAFAKFEEAAHEQERARAIYKYALDNIPRDRAQELYKMFITFEKQHGDRQGIEDVVVGKRRFHYEELIKDNPRNYDVWFDYARLEESEGNHERVREVYERAIANVPPAEHKRFWRRYIYLWINYALYEELEAEDAERTRAVYKEMIRLVPHKQFSFAKIWILYAKFEVRQKQLDHARKIFGQAIGLYPKEKIFKEYIELELDLGNIDRCRKLYEKYLEFMPSNCAAWTKFAELEQSLSEVDRARAIFELAIQQPVLDMPEMLWRCYIDFETEEGENDKARELYRRLLQRTKHVKVWMSFAQFESTADDVGRARKVYADGFASLGELEQKEERLMLLEDWLAFEREQGDEEAVADVEAKQPKRIKKKRQIRTDDGTEAGWEEYYEYVFPDERQGAPNLKILEMAHKWKKQKVDPEDDIEMAPVD